ncbi:ribosomal protein S5 domain 2-type protein [Radiomyces spectabilis]|uniref:ribosomal protein S5 domain 2-type protein n=1 Tax=Radiomyces spectabilis TaxID=64574 RepID=UPI00221E6FD7|nr:ribosomal protein S5 domain 2-type protein [Radiomyces spectabilis]KAI8370658.1 ribosomal protein S5 domain 2-type protein [Radiomyces spectabilis]
MSDQEENRQLQEEESLALESIYGSEAFHADANAAHAFVFTLNLDQDMPEIKSPRKIVLHFYLPPTYPSDDMPVYQISSVYCGGRKIDDKMVAAIDQGFKDLFVPSQVVLFEWINWLQDYLESQVPQGTVPEDVSDLESATDQLTLNDAPEAGTESVQPPRDDRKFSFMETPDIMTGEALVDRKSVFVAHVAKVHSASEVQAVMSKLLENKKIAKATHNIMAYRIALPDGGILQDNDDDGEAAAGGRLAHLLQILNVENVMVVVSRWFGGTLLGADRFKDINNCARKALEEGGFIKDDKATSSDTKQKHRKQHKK